MIILDDLYLFNEGEIVESKDVINEIRVFSNLFSHKGESLIFDTVGFQVSSNLMIVVFPKGYLYNINHINEDVELLIQLLMKIKENNNYYGFEYNVQSNIDEAYLYSCLYIYQYWLKNGNYYEFRSKLERKNYSKINWKRTLKSSYVHDQDNLLDIHGFRLFRDYNTDFSELFNLALRSSIKSLDKLLTVKNIVINTQEISIEKIKNISNKIRRETFNSDKINLLNHIESILLKSSTFRVNRDEIYVYTKHFNLVWETIVSKLLKSDYSSLSRFVPNIKIDLFFKYDNKIEFRQIPDILFISENRLNIVDAKYYDVDYTFPSKDDFLKQFFYDITLKTNLNKKNYMIFCGSINSNLLKIGNVKIENLKGEYSHLNEIGLYIFDTKKAIESFLFNVSSNDYRKGLI